jgi:hypothetical protein
LPHPDAREDDPVAHRKRFYRQDLDRGFEVLLMAHQFDRALLRALNARAGGGR